MIKLYNKSSPIQRNKPLKLTCFSIFKLKRKQLQTLALSTCNTTPINFIYEGRNYETKQNNFHVAISPLRYTYYDINYDKGDREKNNEALGGALNPRGFEKKHKSE